MFMQAMDMISFPSYFHFQHLTKWCMAKKVTLQSGIKQKGTLSSPDNNKSVAEISFFAFLLCHRASRSYKSLKINKATYLQLARFKQLHITLQVILKKTWRHLNSAGSVLSLLCLHISPLPPTQLPVKSCKSVPPTFLLVELCTELY